ncbi:MAG: hypothetical protein AB1716_25420, partial [Planctomycetota bacterium]
ENRPAGAAADMGPAGGNGTGGTGGTGLDPRPSARGLQDAFIDERNDVLAVINELEDQLDRQQELRETLERQLTGATEQLQTANQRAQELEWQVVTLQTRVDALEQLRQDITSLEEELNDANGKLQRTSDQLVAVEKERTRLKGELKTANKQVDELWAIRKERDGLRADYKLVTGRVEELERTQRELNSERTALQNQMQELQANLEDANAGRNQAQIAQRAAEDRIRELAQVQETLEEKLEELRGERKNLQVQITHLERENARLLDQRQFYEAEVTVLRNQSRTAEAALASVKKAFGEVRIALNETRARARRRALDVWPRVGTSLYGIDGADSDGQSTNPGEIARGSMASEPALAPVLEQTDLSETEALVREVNAAATRTPQSCTEDEQE